VAAVRFIGVRLDRDIVFLDRARGRLIHLEPAAVQAWERCTGSVDDLNDAGLIPGTVEPAVAAEALAILTELQRAGVVDRVGDRFVRAPAEWT
jgi:hypothetical protein